MRASGLNAVQTYVAWNWHCPDEFAPCDFAGDRDLASFLRLAQKQGLLVMLRLGPYVCAEWDFGGLPAWILRRNASIKVRSMDPQYLAFVAAWYTTLMPVVKPFL